MGVSFRINATHVVHETIDGEAILIHLGTGTYYSLDGVGSELWGLLSRGASTDQAIAAALGRYEGSPGEIEAGVATLVQDLLAEELLVEDGSSAPDPSRLPDGRIPFTTPVLHTYTDMQEFMLVDPLHEVDEEAGWPHAKSG